MINQQSELQTWANKIGELYQQNLKISQQYQSNMKFTVNSTELSKAIERVIKFVPARPLMPILSNIKLAATDRVELIAFDLSNGVQLCCNAEIIKSGEICVPAQTFSAIAKGMSGQLIIEVIGDTMTISNLSGSCEIQCQPVADYPDIIDDDIDATIQVEIDAKKFAQAIKLGGSCVSDDPTKAILNGVNIVAEDGLLTMASTDGHRLIVYKAAIDENIKIPSSTIPTKSLGAIDGSGNLKLTIDNTVCMAETGDTIVTCRPFDGKYPDYKLLLPKDFVRHAIIDRAELIDTLNLMSSIGSENSLVKFVFEGDKLTVMSDREGVKGERSIACKMTGEAFIIAFNLKYLLGQLKTIPSERVQISMNGALQPVIIEPVDSDLDLLCLVMPVRLRG